MDSTLSRWKIESGDGLPPRLHQALFLEWSSYAALSAVWLEANR